MKLTLAPNRSYKITLPKQIITALDWKHGQEIDIKLQNNALILKKRNAD